MEDGTIEKQTEEYRISNLEVKENLGIQKRRMASKILKKLKRRYLTK
jgi:hypothetical protein